MLAIHDFEDIVNVIEGRAAIIDEVQAASPALRAYLALQFAAVSTAPGFDTALPGLVAFDELLAQRIGSVRRRVAAIAAMLCAS